MQLNIQPNHHTGGTCCVFEHNNQHYYASRCFIPFCGFETMIFYADQNGKVTSGINLYCDRNGKPLEQCINEFIKSV